MQTLDEVPRERAEYVMWLDMDLLMNKMDFTMPLHSYEGKDLVMHGQPEFILQGEAKKGMSCDAQPPAACSVCLLTAHAIWPAAVWCTRRFC